MQLEQKSSSYKILILFAHPALQNSRLNKQLIQYARGLEGVTVHDLYETYPDFYIDVKHEQNLLIEHDIIIFHHPLLWFSVPAILREWMDLVLQHMWAYGVTGHALKGKKLFNVVSAGGGEELFQHDGFHGNTMVEFLAPIRQVARVCGMDFLPPFVVHGTRNITPQAIKQHGNDYRNLLLALRDGRLDIAGAKAQQKINANLATLISAVKD
ncbi:MAG: NAD(P)H-dependent oxidoreductase [Desulfuromonas sp.]|nr:NAD(P)H-dependent oxidoreductase [Desulfuromonas sp.]